MKRLIMTLAIGALGALVSAGPLHAGLFKNSVDLADLADVSADKLETLKDAEFEAFLAEVRMNSAKAGERRAAGSVKTAKRIMEAEELDQKAAEAEVKAAKANNDIERMAVADTHLKAATEDLKSAKALVKWKEQERDTREVEVRMAKSALDVAEARRDVGRARVLVESGLPAAEKYDTADLEKSVSKRQKELEAASRKLSAESAKTEKLKVEWERVARTPVPPEEE